MLYNDHHYMICALKNFAGCCVKADMEVLLQPATCVAFVPGKGILLVGTAAPAITVWDLRRPCCRK